jgi:transposase InsO family protein
LIPRTFQRWRKNDGLTRGDRRPDAIRPALSHALTEEERARIIEVANEPRFAETPPARIVPVLADEGIYIASESSFHRVLRTLGQMTRRGRARPPRRSRPPTTHIATRPGAVWCWDVTFLPATVQGRWFCLYLILDIYSRKIVGFEVHDTDSADHAAHLARRTALAEGVHAMPVRPVLHGDNGATLKGTTVWPCCTGWVSNRLIHGRASATTILMPRLCSAPRNTGRNFRSKASWTWTRHGNGQRASSIGTTTNTATAALNT